MERVRELEDVRAQALGDLARQHRGGDGEAKLFQCCAGFVDPIVVSVSSVVAPAPAPATARALSPAPAFPAAARKNQAIVAPVAHATVVIASLVLVGLVATSTAPVPVPAPVLWWMRLMRRGQLNLKIRPPLVF